MKEDVLQAAMKILIPEEVLKSFELEKIAEEGEDKRIFYLVEKESMMPEAGEPLMKDGYMREIDIMHFPSRLRRSILRLKRRRWVSKADRGRCYCNKYTFTDENMKITREYGAFLKEIGECSPI